MDPYIEGHEWGDFHLMFIAELRRQLTPLLRPRYLVRAEEYVFLVREPEAVPARIRPDALVVESRREERGASAASGGGAAVLEAPITLSLPQMEWHRQPYLEIRRADAGEVVCVIELLSPFNKRGRDREDYLRKRAAVLKSPTHLIEMDLLRGGERLPMEEELPAADYYVLVSRAEARPLCGVWSLTVRDPLPEIPVPLAAGDRDAQISLQRVFDAVYDDAGYGDSLDYTAEAQPPLSSEDRAWVRALSGAR